MAVAFLFPGVVLYWKILSAVVPYRAAMDDRVSPCCTVYHCAAGAGAPGACVGLRTGDGIGPVVTGGVADVPGG